jgi:hypothetical protein
MAEEVILEQVLEAFPIVSGHSITADWDGEAMQIEGSPDFIVGVDGKPFGIEIAQIRKAKDEWDYVAEAWRISFKKSQSYSRRGLFGFPIALLLYSDRPPLCEMAKLIEEITVQEEFEELGFDEIWAFDLSDEFYTFGHPLRKPDAFCFKPARMFGYERIGEYGRKPYG